MFKQVKLPVNIIPHDYQNRFLKHASCLIESNPEQWHLFSSPTGTGKSIMELMFLERYPGTILITPRLEIIAGMMQKLNHYVDNLSDVQLVNLSWGYGITTPIRLREILAKGRLPGMPFALLIDEAHHDLAQTYQDITMYLNGCPKIGLTATPYRGTAKSTQEYHKQWNDIINVVLTLPQAIERKFCTLPQATIWPLVDDDIIDVSNGEFSISSAESVIRDRFDSLVDRIKSFHCSRGRLWDKPTMIAVPSTVCAVELTNKLNIAGLPAVAVTQSSTRSERTKAFHDVIMHKKVLVQINVVSEGVDLPIRRLIDIRPTMSPVNWVQQIGRIMRPTDETPEYICCCRNLERHCYLMEGTFPDSIVRDAQQAFDGVNAFARPYSKRSGVRAIGLEGLGRFKITPIQLVNGLSVFTYHLVHQTAYKRVEYFIVVHPNYPNPVVGTKVSTTDNNNEMKWGKWSLIESIPDVKGMHSATVKPLTAKQEEWWKSAALGYGLDPNIPVNNRMFQILPFMRNTGLTFNRIK